MSLIESYIVTDNNWDMMSRNSNISSKPTILMFRASLPTLSLTQQKKLLVSYTLYEPILPYDFILLNLVSIEVNFPNDFTFSPLDCCNVKPKLFSSVYLYTECDLMQVSTSLNIMLRDWDKELP